MPDIKPFEAVHTITRQTQGTVTPSPNYPAASQEQAAPAPQEEPAPVAAKPEEPKDKILDSERFAALTKKERAIQKRARELQERERSIAKWEEADKLAGTNKLEALKRLGISYDDLTNLHLSQMGVAEEQTPETIAARKAQEITRQELDAFKAEQAKSQQEMQQQQYEAAKQQIHADAERLTNTKPEDFAYVNAEGAHDIIVELIERTYFDTGKLIPTDQAAEEVEKYLEDKYSKISQLPKFRSRYTPDEAQAPKSPVPPDHTQKPQTLTHRSTTAPTRPRNLSQQELRERAIKRFYGQPVE